MELNKPREFAEFSSSLKIGILALQGAFVEHAAVCHRLKAEAKLIRLPEELQGLDGLIIPGGESTTIGRLMAEYHLTSAIKELIFAGLPVFGTCAGMILLAKKATDLDLETLGAIDIEVRRNAFGRQVDSFETYLDIPLLGEPPFPGVFIRAPWIEKAGPEVEILARLPSGVAVAARQRNVLVTAFHPELTSDVRLHAYFLDLAARSQQEGALGKRSSIEEGIPGKALGEEQCEE